MERAGRRPEGEAEVGRVGLALRELAREVAL
jgi:hypothetical protein